MMMFLKKLHKWIGLLVGVQVILWLSSGLVISLLDPSRVSGSQWAHSPADTPPLQFENMLQPADLPDNVLKNALRIDLEVFRQQPVYQVRYPDSTILVNARSGETIEINEQTALTIANEGFAGNGEVFSIRKGIAPDIETRKHAGPYWRVDFSDAAQSTYYISAWNGEILERRNKYWRTHDFFWMLHIMDYPDREDFNNSLIIGVALIAAWLGISGFILLFGSFGRQDFWFLNIIGERKQRVVTVIDPLGGKTRKMKLRMGGNLFLALAHQGVDLPSKCGGGGECGQCRVKLTGADLAEPSVVERKLLANSLLGKGFRLACQQEISNHVTLHLPGGTLSESGKTGI